MSFLFERDDFQDLVVAAAEYHGIANPAIVEKDYYVTESLRIIARAHGYQVIFKGGTSLSKGWNLIRRFSEDIDLYVAPSDSDEATAARLRVIADAVAAFSGFTGRESRERQPEGTWSEEFVYRGSHDGSAVRTVVFLEAGIQSADQPTEDRALTSLLGVVLDARGVDPESDDRAPFPMRLLHFRRTFVEKLFTLHSRVERCVRQNSILGRDARHYYDLAMLIREPQVLDMLTSDEYSCICSEYLDLTGTFYPNQLKHLPANMNLRESPALFPGAGLKTKLAEEYKRECETLCFDHYPPFEEALSAFESIRDRLELVDPPSEAET